MKGFYGANDGWHDCKLKTGRTHNHECFCVVADNPAGLIIGGGFERAVAELRATEGKGKS